MDYNAKAKSVLDPIHKVGKITKLYGEQGGIVLKLNAGEISIGNKTLELTAKELLAITHNEPLWIQIESIATPFFIASAKPQGASAIAITFDYIDNQQKAQILIGQSVYINSVERQREKASDWEDLTQRTFVDKTSGKTGIVIEVIENSLNPLLFVQIDQEEYYVPLAEDLIVQIDDNEIVYALPENFF